jgi:hypothetical protein
MNAKYKGKRSFKQARTAQVSANSKDAALGRQDLRLAFGHSLESQPFRPGRLPEKFQRYRGPVHSRYRLPSFR